MFLGYVFQMIFATEKKTPVLLLGRELKDDDKLYHSHIYKRGIIRINIANCYQKEWFTLLR